MIEKYYEALQKRENLRENLVGLRAQIKDEAAKEQFVSMIGDGGLLLALDTSFPTGLFFYKKFPCIIYYNIFVIKSKYCAYTGRARKICILARPLQRRYTGLKTGGGLIEGANRL